MKPEKQKVSTGLTSQIKREAQRLGFALVGVSPVKAPPHEKSFAEWLTKGFAGEMAYMTRTAELRKNSKNLSLLRMKNFSNRLISSFS